MANLQSSINEPNPAPIDPILDTPSTDISTPDPTITDNGMSNVSNAINSQLNQEVTDQSTTSSTPDVQVEQQTLPEESLNTNTTPLMNQMPENQTSTMTQEGINPTTTETPPLTTGIPNSETTSTNTITPMEQETAPIDLDNPSINTETPVIPTETPMQDNNMVNPVDNMTPTTQPPITPM